MIRRRSPPNTTTTIDRGEEAIAFIEGTLIDPETGLPFVLTGAERTFLRHAFRLNADGGMLYPELVYSCPKKSGKTAFAAMILIFVVRVLGGRFAEGYTLANDKEQASSRVHQAAARIVEASPLLRPDAKVREDRIEFRSTGGTIIAMASDYASAAGANPSISCFDELWAYTSERSHRLWDEMIPPPTRKIACRLTCTYAGFEGEGGLLQDLHKRGTAGTLLAPDLYCAGGLLMYWSNSFSAPWQTEAWREQMRATLRPNQYLRLIENRWVSGEESFVPVEWWDACVDGAAAPLLEDHNLRVYVGVDASYKRDSTAIVACSYDRVHKKVRLVWHRIFQPSRDNPLDFESTIELELQRLCRRFRVAEVRYDPYQMVAVAQRLTGMGLPMVEFPQSVPNLTEASNNLYELVKGRNLVLYPDAEMRLAAQRAVAVETPRGWKISKSAASHKIDVVVALAQAALGAVEQASHARPMILAPEQLATLRVMPRQRFGSMYDGGLGGGRNRFARAH